MNTQIDPRIPVLTDIIDPALIEEVQGASAPHDPPLHEDDWQQLERNVRQSVLLQLNERIDFVLEHRVRDSLADVLQTAVSGLAEDIREGLHRTLKEVVSRAVQQELSRIKAQK